METINLRKDLYVVLLRGLPGIGKSTWVRNNNLEFLVLSPDTFRNMLIKPDVNFDDNGKAFIGINQKLSGMAWCYTELFLTNRLMNNSSTIIDATFMSNSNIYKFKALAKQYCARVLIIDFGNDLDIALERNKGRKDTISYVPEYVIKHMNENGNKQKLSELISPTDPCRTKIVKPNEINLIFK